MPLNKLLRTPVSKYTEPLRAELKSNHDKLHSIHSKILSKGLQDNDAVKRVTKIHELVVKKFKILGLPHSPLDDLDGCLPEKLKQLAGRAWVGADSDGPVSLVRKAGDEDSDPPRGEIWIKGGDFKLKTTDQELMRAWKEYATDVAYYDVEDSEKDGFLLLARMPKDAGEGLEALGEAFWESDFWLDWDGPGSDIISDWGESDVKSFKAWSPAAQEASIAARRRGAAERGPTKRERKQPYEGAGLAYVKANMKVSEEGASSAFAKQVLSTLPKTHLAKMDVDFMTVHSTESFLKTGKGHLKAKEGGVLWLTPKSATGGKGGPEVITVEIHLNGGTPTRVQKQAIVRAIGRTHLTSLTSAEGKKVFNLFGGKAGPARTSLTKLYVKAYTAYASGNGARAKLDRKAPNVYSYFKQAFGLPVGKSFETIKQRSDEDISKYDDKQLRAIHHSLHNRYGQWAKDSIEWEGFKALDDWVGYHVRITKAMEERGITHGSVDDLDQKMLGELKKSITTVCIRQFSDEDSVLVSSRAGWIGQQVSIPSKVKGLVSRALGVLRNLITEKLKSSLVEEREVEAEEILAKVAEGDEGSFVMQIHDAKQLHVDWRLELKSMKGTFAGFRLYIPKKLRKEYGDDNDRTLRETGEAVVKHLLSGGALAGSHKIITGPNAWMRLGNGSVVTFTGGGVGGSPASDGHLLAAERGNYKAGPSIEGGHSVAFKLDGLKIKNKWVVGAVVKGLSDQMNGPEERYVGEGNVWLFRLLKEGALPVEDAKLLTQRTNKNTGKTEYCLVSRSKPTKILEWFGAEKPSAERLAKAEQRINVFRHLNKGGENLEIRCRECSWVGMSNDCSPGIHGIICPSCKADLVDPEEGVLRVNAKWLRLYVCGSCDWRGTEPLAGPKCPRCEASVGWEEKLFVCGSCGWKGTDTDPGPKCLKCGADLSSIEDYE